MRGLTRRWLQSRPVAGEEALAPTGLPALVRRILAARGMTDPQLVERFCSPQLTDLEPPERVPGATEAAHRLADAIRRGAKIAIYGDYDVDGITATAILYHAFKTARPDAAVVTYVPHRLSEGYGINADALRQLHADGVEVVVSVDCGVTAVEPARVARELGLELIVTDHHALPADGILPDALVVHPQRPDAATACGNPDLCGAGVAFKLAWCFAVAWCGTDRVAPVFRELLLQLLPLVALGSIADVVPLTGENRVLTAYGLRLIQTTKLVGLNALLEATRLRGENVDAQKVGYVLGPHLNAIGRMGHAAEAVQLFTSADPDEAKRIAEALAGYNAERQDTQRRIVAEASASAVEAGMTEDERRIIVLAHADWHAGVVGICCSRLVEEFGRPSILLQRQGDICRGSARSVDGYDIHAALSACAEHLEAFGGHPAAAGLTLRADRLDAFTDAITRHAAEHIAVEDLVPAIRIDCEAQLDELDAGTVGRLSALSPFGRANRRPVIRLSGLVLSEWPQAMGANGKHLALRVRNERERGNGVEMRTVWWNAGSRAEHLPRGARLDVAIEPKLNTWNGRTTVEGEIRDVRLADG